MKKVCYLSITVVVVLCGAFSTYGMNLEIKNEIAQLTTRHLQTMQQYVPTDEKHKTCFSQYYNDLAVIVGNNVNQMNDTDKLNFLLGDEHYESRKTIIMSLLRARSDILKNKMVRLTFYDALQADDKDFVEFLSKHGVVPNFKTVNLLQQKVARYLSVFEKCLAGPIAGMYYKKDDFGAIFPLWEDISLHSLTQCLVMFVNTLKDREERKPFLVEIPHSKAGAITAVKEAGFEYYHGDNGKTEWILRNGSSIPDSFTANFGAHVIVTNGESILVIEENTRKGIVSFPAGTGDSHELPRHTATRELFEEVALKVAADQLKLIALANRTESNRFGANCTDFYYTVPFQQVTGGLKIDNYEVGRALWIPIKDLATQPKVEGLVPYPLIVAIAQHLLEGRNQSYFKPLFDHRHPLNVVQHVEFFAQ